MNSFIYRGGNHQNQSFKTKIYIGLHKKHYSSILSLTGLFSKSYYCEKCEFAFDKRNRHICEETCKNCLERPVCERDNDFCMTCEQCNKQFISKVCFERHKRNNVCENNKICKACNSYYNKRTKKGKLIPHICNTYYCKICNSYQQKEHLCYVQRLVPEKKCENMTSENTEESDSDSYDSDSDENIQSHQCYSADPFTFKHIYFDLETATVDGYFIPILAVAHKVCEKCECKPITHRCIDKCGKRDVVFKGESCLKIFCQWLFQPRHKGYTVISHNGGAFDIQFVLRYLHENLIYPKIVTRGGRILQMLVKDYGIRFIDSLNFMKSKLADMTTSMGLSSIGSKGYFPYKALTREYYNYVGPKLPLDMYQPGTMSPKERVQFLNWYENLPVDYIFDFNRELLSYCQQDVTILREACLKFRKLIIEVSEIDPFSKECTIAGLTTRIWRTKYMPENTVGVVPPNRYVPTMNTSYKAIAFFEFERKRTGFEIRHAGRGGEVRIDGYHVDGKNMDTGLVYLFHGCLHHGCPLCYDGNLKHPLQKDLKFHEVFEKHLKRVSTLKKKIPNLCEIWEHYYDERVKNDPEFKEFVTNLDIEKHKNIEPRDALFGGRTEGFRTYHKTSSDEKIHYVDIRSLYPKVLRDSKFPSKHPEVYSCLTHDLGKVTDYFGICKVKILAPKTLWLLLLPYRSKKTGKLTFSLC